MTTPENRRDYAHLSGEDSSACAMLAMYAAWPGSGEVNSRPPLCLLTYCLAADLGGRKGCVCEKR